MKGEGFYISKVAALVAAVAAAAAVLTIIALSAAYSQERSKNDVKSTTTSPASTPSSSGPKEPWELYRLPTALSPLSYNVTMWPRLAPDDRGMYVFSGRSEVLFTCLRETDLILVHSNKLNLTEMNGTTCQARLAAVDGAAEAPGISRTWLEVPTQYLVVQLTAKLEVGKSYRLYTEFTGELAYDLEGFYRSEYMEDGTKKVLAATHMAPTGARKALPCFDEPAMKSVFHMTLIHPHGTVALANAMDIMTVNITMQGQSLLQTSFEPTEVMSTYLLACVVCDFGFISSPPGDAVQIRMWARRKYILEGQGDYALEKTGPILSFFEGYYNSTFPLKKSDQISLPDFGVGGMENWGLITYSESLILYNPNVSSSRDKEQVVAITSHELAHMWFGNLVTMRWWNELWLKEGFASYAAYLGIHSAEPTWGIKARIVVDMVHSVMEEDALASSHPLSTKEEEIQTPEQINEMYDLITYSKGAAVLRMLSDVITEDVFSKGLVTYLNMFKYSNTVYTDLWEHLQKAVDSASPSLGLPYPVEDFMNRWILQMGFPVVTIDTRTGSISQKHFLLDPDSPVNRTSPFNYEWIVPIKWIKTGAVQEHTYWLDKKEDTNPNMTCSSSADWIMANIDTSGFYRVNYDSQNWERLLAALQTNPQQIPLINRAQIIEDAFNLARAKMVNITLALKTTQFLVKETEYMPWQTAGNNLHYFHLMFDRSEVYGPMQAYIKKQVTPLFHYFKNITANWTKIPEGHSDQYNQVNAIFMACSTGVEGCEELVTGWFRQWMSDPTRNPIHPNLRGTVYCSAIAAGGAEEWDFGWSMYRNATVSSEGDKLLSALACSREPWLLNRYIDYCLDPEKISKQYSASYIINQISTNSIGQPLVWDFVRAKWDLINDYGGSLIYGVTDRFSSEFEYKQLLQFKEDHADGAATSALEEALERTKANIDWVTMNKDQVLTWFTEQAA